MRPLLLLLALASFCLLDDYNDSFVHLQLQICYDMQAAILYVTVIKAKNLRYVNNLPPDPFVKCYLLPPRV